MYVHTLIIYQYTIRVYIYCMYKTLCVTPPGDAAPTYVDGRTICTMMGSKHTQYGGPPPPPPHTSTPMATTSRARVTTASARARPWSSVDRTRARARPRTTRETVVRARDGNDDDDTDGGVDAPSRKVYVETYGCQMNVNDTEVMLEVLRARGYDLTTEATAADVILINTCAIRDKAEAKIWQRLAYFRSIGSMKKRRARPIVGVLGCMAERVKEKLLEADRLADIVAGPDAYRDLPNLIDAVRGTGEKAMNVQLSVEETYADIIPVREVGTHSAFVTIMRGCDNACAFCIVPYTRGRERSRDLASVMYEIRSLSERGIKEVTLLGQNVNSYAGDVTSATTRDFLSQLRGEDVDAVELVANASSAGLAGAQGSAFVGYADGFKSRYDPERKREGTIQFAELLDKVASVDPEMRIRFTSPHPKDFPDDVLRVIRDRPNVSKCLHMPAQSGSTATLERMARGYTREAYIELIDRVKMIIPGCAVTTDIISGFCGETEADHEDTVSLMTRIGYEQAFMFAYSEREGTGAHRHQKDDVPEDVKQRRLQEVIDAFRAKAAEKQRMEIGSTHCVLVEGPSKKNPEELTGKTDTSKWVIFDDAPTGSYTGDARSATTGSHRVSPGDYVAVRVTGCSTGTLFGELLGKTTLTEFQRLHGAQWTTPAEAGAAAR